MTDSLWRDAPDEGESDEPDFLAEAPLHGEARTALFVDIQRVSDNPDDEVALAAIRENAARLSLPHCDVDLQLALFEAALGTKKAAQILSILFEAGLDPRATDDNGQTALMFAAARRDLEATRLLLPLSNARKKRHDSMAVDLAFGHYQRTNRQAETPESQQCLADLIEATPRAPNAASLWLPSFAKNGDIVLLRAVLASLDIDRASFWTSERSVSLLAAAASAESDSAECVDILLESGADPKLRHDNGQGETALIALAAFRHGTFTPGVSRLLEHIDPNATNDAGRTALMTAALSASNGLLRGLLPFSDANAVDHEGDTALSIAARASNVKALNLLLPATDLSWRDAKGRTVLEERLAAAMNNRRDEWECVDALSSTLSPQNAERMIRDLVAALLPRTAALAESAALAREAGLSSRTTRTGQEEGVSQESIQPQERLLSPNGLLGPLAAAPLQNAALAADSGSGLGLRAGPHSSPNAKTAKQKGRL